MTLDSWDIAHALEVQAHVSKRITSHPAIQAQLMGSQASNFLSPYILRPQHTGGHADPSSAFQNEATAPEEQPNDGIAREKKGAKEPMPMEKNL